MSGFSMGAGQTGNLRFKVSPAVAAVVRGGREEQYAAAHGQGGLQGKDRLTALFFLSHGGDREIRTQALQTARRMPLEELEILLAETLHPRLVDFVARLFLNDPDVMGTLLRRQEVPQETLIRIAERAGSQVLMLICEDASRWEGNPDLIDTLRHNPNAPQELLSRVGLPDASEPAADETEPSSTGESEGEEPDFGATEEGGDDAAVEEVNLSKYQQIMNFEVAEKIKYALTGDKEWRNLLIKESNKLVSAAVLKNPRITEGEVLLVAKNKSANDELIRLITLNREWIKNYEIQKALVEHPRTPLAKALKYMSRLSPKDLKNLTTSRTVSTAIVNNARRLLAAKKVNR